MSSTPQPWERDARESDREFQLFSLYRLSGYPQAKPGDMGPFQPRHLGRFAREVLLSETHIYRLSSHHRWAARCAAYDRQVDREQTEANFDAVARARLSQARELSLLRELLHDGLAALIDAQRAGTAHLKPSDLTAMLKALHDSERVLNGEATSRTDVRVASVNLNQLRDELGLRGQTPEERQADRDRLRRALSSTTGE